MSNIEDIENVRSFLFKLKDGTELKLVEKENYDKLVERIKELEVLEVLEDDLKDKRVVYIDTPEFAENYIPKQKVKDKIEENNKIMIDTQNKYPGTYAMLDEWRNAKAQNDILEELLEDK